MDDGRLKGGYKIQQTSREENQDLESKKVFEVPEDKDLEKKDALRDLDLKGKLETSTLRRELVSSRARSELWNICI